MQLQAMALIQPLRPRREWQARRARMVMCPPATDVTLQTSRTLLKVRGSATGPPALAVVPVYLSRQPEVGGLLAAPTSSRRGEGHLAARREAGDGRACSFFLF